MNGAYTVRPVLVAPRGEIAADCDEGMRIGTALDLDTAGEFCRAVRHCLALGCRTLSLDGSDVIRADVVGLAALLQCTRLAERNGLPCTVAVNPLLWRRLVQSRLLDEISVAMAPGAVGAASVRPPDGSVLARLGRLTLRTVRPEDLALFEAWGRDPFVDQMVGSDLLYRYRHLGCQDTELAAYVLDNATSLTMLVDVMDFPGRPVGFARLYDVHLADGLGFLEVVVADDRALRRGWGVQAARLLLAYAQDALGIRRVEAKAYAYNALSINALRRNGFQQEGVLREARLYDGQYWDIIVFSILDREMRAERGRDAMPYMGFWPEAA